MKKSFFPIVLAIVSIGIFLAMIMRYEYHLGNGKTIFVELQPTDPRSFIQGDYMALNYQLYLPNNVDEISNDNRHLQAWITLDNQQKVIKTEFSPNQQAIALWLKNPYGSVANSYPASDSFLFAEGLGECYQNAKFAKFKVDETGKPLLAELVGENLQVLNCEQNSKN